MNGEFYNTYNNNLSEETYVDSLLSKNIRKKITIHLNNNDNKDISGILENIGKDYLILSESSTGYSHVVLPIYVNYITFEEEINY